MNNVAIDRLKVEWVTKIDPLSLLHNYKGSKTYYNSNEASSFHRICLGKKTELEVREGKDAFDQLRSYIKGHKDFLVCFLSYDLKNELENLQSNNPRSQSFPLLHCYQPEWILDIYEESIEIAYFPESDIEEMKSLLSKSKYRFEAKPSTGAIEASKLDPELYKRTFTSLHHHIQRGDIYEVNFCNEFHAEDPDFDAISVYKRLNEMTAAPFSVFYHDKDNFLLSGSPERYIKKSGQRVISQPIKGTIKRGIDSHEDDLLKEKLRNDPKEQAENVMIVDLVRNDLSRVAQVNSVHVDELFGVYTFKTVHQLISTISCNIKEEYDIVDVIKATFPMGSMTGAPKVSAMELIEKYENFERSAYSGAFGYIDAKGDFDFNVIIRSILYNSKNQIISFPVGGALTSLANDKDELAECLLKSEAMKKAL